MFFTLFGCLDGGNGVGHNLLVFHPRQLKNGNSSKGFSDILTIHNDQISDGKNVSDPLYVFFTLLGCLD